MLSKSLSKAFGSSLFAKNFFCTTQTIRTPIAQRPGFGSDRHITVIPGIGIGPEVTNSVMKILKAALCPLKFEVLESFDPDTLSNPAELEKVAKNETILLGMIQKRYKDKYKDTTRIYKELNLFANVTYAKSLPNVNLRHKDVDIVVIRENTEGEFSGVEHEVYPGVVESLKIITKAASDRIANYAFEFAYVSGRKKVTAVHKANIMKLCDGLFLESCREAAKKYPFIEYDEIIIDNCCMQLVKNPWKFDVMVMPNLYGTIVSNTVAGIVGGPGMTCGANIGDKNTLFEQGTRHSGVDIAGTNKANPTALILSSIMMLKHLGLPKFASDIEKALGKTYADGKVRTRDVGGSNSTEEFTEAIIKNLH